MYYYYYIRSALNSIFYINFILVLYIIFLLFIFILISIYLWPVLYLMALCGACCRLHEHENKWNENERTQHFEQYAFFIFHNMFRPKHVVEDKWVHSVQSVVFVLIIKTITDTGYIYGAAKLKKKWCSRIQYHFHITQSKFCQHQNNHQVILTNAPFSSTWQFYSVIETESKWGINCKYCIKASSYGWQKQFLISYKIYWCTDGIVFSPTTFIQQHYLMIYICNLMLLSH